MKTNLEQAMHHASATVLETMFFSEAGPQSASDAQHLDPVYCDVTCSGAEEGLFAVSIDRDALIHLCHAFYGDEEGTTEKRQSELLCELTNMVAGSTLSSYAPERACRISPPSLCNPDVPRAEAASGPSVSASVYLQLEGGLLSMTCRLRSAA